MMPSTSWSTPLKTPVFNMQLRIQPIIHGLHDEARHQGEMYLLLKLCNRPSE